MVTIALVLIFWGAVCFVGGIVAGVALAKEELER